MIFKRFELAKEYPQISKNGAEPFLRCYLQEDCKRPSPALIICPGGGYSCCAEGEGERVALEFFKTGFHIFILNYSVCPHVFPQAMCEVAAAVDLVQKHSDEWMLDGGKIAIMGFSAGGHLAASYSAMYNDPAVKAVIDSAPVQASVLCYPVITADPAFCHLGSMQNLTGKQALTDEDITHFSVEKQVNAATPPAFLWHTAADNVVPVRNSLEYAMALKNNGVNFEMHIFPEGGHGLDICQDTERDEYNLTAQATAAAWVPLAQNWLKRIFEFD